MLQGRRTGPKRGKNRTSYNKKENIRKKNSFFITENCEDVSSSSSTEASSSVYSNATTIPLPGRLKEVLTDFDSDASTVDLEKTYQKRATCGEEGNRSCGKNRMPWILRSSPYPPSKNSSKINNSDVLNHSSSSLPSSDLFNDKTISDVTLRISKSGYQNSTRVLDALHAVMSKRNISVIRKSQASMLNSQVSIIPFTESSNIPKKNDLSKADLMKERKGPDDCTKINDVYTIDLTKNSPEKTQAPQRSEQPRSNDVQFVKPAVPPNKRKDCNEHRASPYLAIPVVDLRDQTVNKKLTALGIRSAIPLSELYSQAADGLYMLPIVNMASTPNPIACNIDGIGASSMLPLGKLVDVASQIKK